MSWWWRSNFLGPFRETEYRKEVREIYEETRRKRTIQKIWYLQTPCTLDELLYHLNDTMETAQSQQMLMQRLQQEGWLQQERTGREIRWSYLFGEGDGYWKGEYAWMDNEQKNHTYRMCNGLLSRDQRVLDYLRAHGDERFLVRGILARVFDETEKVTSKMVRDSLEWLVEKGLAVVEEDENGRLLFCAAPEADEEAR